MRCRLIAQVNQLLSNAAACIFYCHPRSTWVQEHRFEFDEAPSVEAVAAQLSRLALKFNGYEAPGEQGEGQGGGGLAMSRPVGVALLMAGIDCGGRPVLYHLDPTGRVGSWRPSVFCKGRKSSSPRAEQDCEYVSQRCKHVMAHAVCGSSILLLFPPVTRSKKAYIWWELLQCHRVVDRITMCLLMPLYDVSFGSRNQLF